MAEVNIERQMNITNNFKQEILKRIEETNTLFEKRENDLLAAVLYRYYNRDNYDGDAVSKEDFGVDKKAYLNFLASDKEDVKKAIAENERVFNQQKQKIKSSIIDFLKFKSEIYVANIKTISELETEMINRKKLSCKLNEEIAACEPKANILKEALEDKKAQLKEIEDRKAIVDAKLAEYDSKILNGTISANDPQVNSEMMALLGEQASLGMQITQKNSEIEIATEEYSMATSGMDEKIMELSSLSIESFEEKLSKAKEGNENLYQSIEEDIIEFKNAGFEITKQDVIKKGPSSQPTQQQTTPQQKSANTQQTQSTQQPQQTTQPQQNPNLPANQTPAQRAYNLKNQILGGTAEDTKSLLANNGYSDILDSINTYNNRDKKLLMDKIGNLNTPTDINKLSNVISAINRSGLCSNLDISNLINSDGSLKDFSSMSNDDIDNLNKFINEIEANKNYIDDEQLDFLQNNFVNNIKCNSLKQSLKPKTFKDLFKSKATKERDSIRNAKLGILSSTLSSIIPKKQNSPTKSSDIRNDLRGNTRDNIEPPTNTRSTPNIDQQTR